MTPTWLSWPNGKNMPEFIFFWTNVAITGRDALEAIENYFADIWAKDFENCRGSSYIATKINVT